MWFSNVLLGWEWTFSACLSFIIFNIFFIQKSDDNITNEQYINYVKGGEESMIDDPKRDQGQEANDESDDPNASADQNPQADDENSSVRQDKGQEEESAS